MIPAFDGLPRVPEKRLAVQLRPDAFRQLRGGHPWVYADSIDSVKGDTSVAGTLAVVFDRDRAFAGIGLWDPDSPIRIRVLHAGKPTTIDRAFWEQRMADAASLRAKLPAAGTTAFRLINGENDGFGGLVIDRYDTTLVVKVYSSAWLPHLNAVVESAVAETKAERVVLRLGRLLERHLQSTDSALTDGQTVLGDGPDDEIRFRENGLLFDADVIDGQKTGHFLDQRENRQRVRDLVTTHRRSGQPFRVLDVFSCTGGFSVHAAAGGATFVHSVDQSPHAIAASERHMRLNVDDAVVHKTSVGDAFEVLAECGANGDTFDIVIVDPPSFASRASERDGAMRAYRKLAELAVPLVARNGWLIQASCSSRISEDDLVGTAHAAIRTHRREVADEEITGHAVDHPVTFPQGRYLKAIFARLD